MLFLKQTFMLIKVYGPLILTLLSYQHLLLYDNTFLWILFAFMAINIE
jgi:hypothetical protein